MDVDREIQPFKQSLKMANRTIDLNFSREKDTTQKSESQSNTQSVLENVCLDFESIDVLAPKESKLISSKSIDLPQNWQEESVAKVNLSVTDRQLVTVGSLKSNTNSTIISKKENSEPKRKAGSAVKLKTDIETPIQNFTAYENVSADNSEIMSSSLAELADAEIVQTSGDSVSIVITNPRLIKVLTSSETNSENAFPPPCVVSENDFISGNPSTQPFTLVQEDFSPNDINLPEIHTETVYADHLKKVPVKNGSKKMTTPVSTSFSTAKKSSYKTSYSRNNGNITKARRITVKMKNELQRKLLENSCLLCPMSGCSKSFKTLANFITHYKFCTGQKDFKQCPHCKSVIFSSNKAVLHHMAVEHPEKLAEYKATLPDVEEVIEETQEKEEIPVRRYRSTFSTEKIYSTNSVSSYHSLKNKNTFRNTVRATHINSELENIKEFKKCVRFDDIVSKIHSACDEKEETAVKKEKGKSSQQTKYKFQQNINVLPSQKNKMQKLEYKPSSRFFAAEDMDDNQEYLEDIYAFEKEKDNCDDPDTKISINTKSRLVLDQFKQYERYIKSLKLTRDWSTTRRTYSKSTEPKRNDNSASTSLCSNMAQNEDAFGFHDVHQLSETYLNPSFDDEISQIQTPTADLSIYSSEVGSILPDVETFEKEQSYSSSELKLEYPDFRNNVHELNNKRIPCYLKSSTPNPKIPKVPVITYGKNMPEDRNKKLSSILDFDVLLENSYRKMTPNNVLNNEMVFSTEDNKMEVLKNISQLPLKENIKEEKEEHLNYFVKDTKLKKYPKTFHVMSKSLKKARYYKTLRNKLSILNKLKSPLTVQDNLQNDNFEKIPKSPDAVVSEDNNCKIEKNENSNNFVQSDLVETVELNSKTGSREMEKPSESNFEPVGEMDQMEKSAENLEQDNLPSSKEILTETISTAALDTQILKPDTVSSSNGAPLLQEIVLTDKNTAIKRGRGRPKKYKTELNTSRDDSISSLKSVGTSEHVVREEHFGTEIETAVITNEVNMPATLLTIQGEVEISCTSEEPRKSEIDKRTELIMNDIINASASPAVLIDGQVKIKRGRGRPRKIRPAVKTELVTDAPLPEQGPTEVGRGRKSRTEEITDDLPASVLPHKGQLEIKSGRGRKRKSRTDEIDEIIADDVFASPISQEVQTEIKRGRGRKSKIYEKAELITSDFNDTAASPVSQDGQIEVKRGRGRPKKNTETGQNKMSVSSTSTPSELLKDTSKDADPNLYSNNTLTCALPPKKRKILELDEFEANLDSELSPQTFSRQRRKKYKNDEDYEKDLESLEHDLLMSQHQEDDLDYIPPRHDEEDFDYTPHRISYKRKRKDAQKMLTLLAAKGEFISHQPPSQGVAEQPLFLKYKPRPYMFECLSKCGNFFHEETEIAFQFNSKNELNTEAGFTNLRRFESLMDTHGPIGSTIFTGGPITCAAFVPTPRGKNQYCALSTTNGNTGVIQFYNLNFGRNNTERGLPKLELAIMHSEEAIYEMAFCPKGCYELPVKSEGTLPRLALLAVAVENSIKVYPIPHPDSLKRMHSTDKTSSDFYKLKEASAVLHPLFGEPSLVAKTCMCTSLSWKKSEFCDKIIAGYSNGMVYIWALSENSNSIATAIENEIMPFVTLKAHGTCVTSVNFHPMFDRFIVTSGFDRTLKIFDMLDTAVPLCSVKRGSANHSVFDPDLCGAFVTLHDGITLSTYFKDCGTEELEDNISSSLCSLTEKTAFSEKINTLAIADMNGSIFLSRVNKNGLTSGDQMKLHYNNCEIFHTKVVPLKDNLRGLTSVVSHVTDVVHVVNELVDSLSTASYETGDHSVVSLPSAIPCIELEAMSTITASSVNDKPIPANLSDSSSHNQKTSLDNKCVQIESATAHSVDSTEHILTEELDVGVKVSHSGSGVVKDPSEHSHDISLQSDSLLASKHADNKIETLNFALDRYLSFEHLNTVSEKLETEIEGNLNQKLNNSDDSMLSDCSNNSLSVLSAGSVASDSHLNSPEFKNTQSTKDTASMNSGNSNSLDNEKNLSEGNQQIHEVSDLTSSVINVDDVSEMTSTLVEIPLNSNNNSMDVLAASCSEDKTTVYSCNTLAIPGQSTNLCDSELERNACNNISFPSSDFSSIVKTHGLIFTDLDISNHFTSLNVEDREKTPDFFLGQSIFSSVKTVAWNPNVGHENWLLSGSNSGIARLRCLSELNINQENDSSEKNIT